MKEKVKKVLGKTVKFAVTVCTILGGIVLVSSLPLTKIKEKFKKQD